MRILLSMFWLAMSYMLCLSFVKHLEYKDLPARALALLLFAALLFVVASYAEGRKHD